MVQSPYSMEDLTTAVCWACGGKISPEDNYCRFCAKGQGKYIPWYYKHWGIIALTVMAMGPFSLIFVWKSPLLSRRAKWAYTAAILAATWYLVLTIYNWWLAFSAFLCPMMNSGGGTFGNLIQ